MRTDARGGVDMDDLRRVVDEDVAGLMLTNPSTTGLFEENIAEMRRAAALRGRAALLRRREPERA